MTQQNDTTKINKASSCFQQHIQESKKTRNITENNICKYTSDKMFWSITYKMKA